MILTDSTPTVFCTRTHRLIDTIRLGETAQTALSRLEAYGPDLTILPFQEACERHEAAYKTEPMEISEAYWHEALNVLPPVAWHNTAAGESFKMSERTTGAVTAIYVRINARHFTLSDDIRTPHAECVSRVLQSKAYRDGPEADNAGLDEPTRR
ncbi:MAG: DUF1419 domain-containing protein [Hyphomicrobiaceae bacterium]|nr:DUF1419 domain-containing protein [Hyphomicrobiaceae bacterium]